MEGLPVVVLQSCDSLDERVLWRIDELGGVALVGSVTPIHSGSGSSLVQAMSDAILYRGADLGRGAPRRAELLVLPRRVEDPPRPEGTGEEPPRGLELPALGRSGVAGGCAAGRAARRLAFGGAVVGRGGVGDRRAAIAAFPRPATRSILPRMFPGSQSSGMVKPGASRRRGRSVRSISFACRCRTICPPAARCRALDGQTNRLAQRIDPVGKFLYVVFLPDVERAGETIALRWGAAASGSAAGEGGAVTARRATPQVVILLVLLGTAAILVRQKYLHETRIALGDSVWRLTYSVGFHARKNDAKLRVSLPLDTRHARVFNLPKTLNPDADRRGDVARRRGRRGTSSSRRRSRGRTN